MDNATELQNGGCTCGEVRYQTRKKPLIVHACHCRWCQRQTGGPHVINALIESDCVELTAGTTECIQVPSPSNKGQDIVRCASCKVALWSHYDFGGMREHLLFLRVGTLDNPDSMPPDVHIFTSTKAPWYLIHPSHLAVEEFYDVRSTWSPDSLQRLQKLKTAMSS